MNQPSEEYRHVWLVGASSGIGEALAKQLFRSGLPSRKHGRKVRLSLSARREEVLARLVKDLVAESDDLTSARSSGRVGYAPMDSTKEEEVRQAHSLIVKERGPVDVLIYCTGINNGDRLIRDMSMEQVRHIVDTNFTGLMWCTLLVLPDMRAKAHGHIVGINSLASRRAVPKTGVYGSTKAAMTLFLDTLRIEEGHHGIHVTDVLPGFVDTPAIETLDHPKPFMITSEQAASIILRGVAQRKRTVGFPWLIDWLTWLSMLFVPFFIWAFLFRRVLALC
ncbi:Short-chain dehydrogenase [Balamuthia mandrillaris]